MHRLRIAALASTIAALTACSDSTPSSNSQTAEASANCPSQAEAEASLTAYVNNEYWSPGQRDIWKITGVDGFAFAPMQVGSIAQKQVEYGKMAQDVCPVRITYSFVAHHADGRAEKTEMGKGKTHLFYKNPFNEWVFKTE